MSLQEKAEKDLVIIMKYISSQDLRNDIFSLFIKGPDPDTGFMWTPTEWWSENEAKGLKIVSEKVLELDWDSSGYGFMMRLIQQEVKKTFRYNDDGQGFAKAYQKTGFGKAMDENNKEALDVMAKKGSGEAVKHMMNMSGGDYARMRMDFG